MRPAYLTADISSGGCGSASPHPWSHSLRSLSIRAGQKGGNWFRNPLWEPQCPLCPLKTGAPSLGWQLQPGGGLGWRNVPSPVLPLPSTSHQLPQPEAISLQFNSFRCIFLQELVWAPSATGAFIHTGASCWDLMLGAGEGKWHWWDWETWGALMGVISLQGHAGDY